MSKRMAVVAAFGMGLSGCGAAGKVNVSVANANGFNVPIGSLEIRSFKAKAKTLVAIDGIHGIVVGGQIKDATTQEVLSGSLVDADNRPVSLSKAKLLDVKDADGNVIGSKIENHFMLTPRTLKCADSDIANWRYDVNIVTTTPGVIIKGASGKVDILAANEELVFEATAVQGSDGSGIVIGSGCVEAGKIGNNGNVAFTIK